MTPPTLKDHFMSFVTPEPNSGCWLWTGGTNASASRGYGVFFFRKKSSQAHRVSYTLFRGEIPEGMHACHKCDVRLCVNPDHIFIGTRSDNMRDCVAKGRLSHNSPRGILNKRAARKLSDEQILEVFSLINQNSLSNQAIARRFGMCPEAIRKIRIGRAWAHFQHLNKSISSCK